MEDKLLFWLEENASELVAESSPIADTGDYSTQWLVYEHHGYTGGKPKRVPIGYGSTPAQAITDAMLPSDDPRKYTFVPKNIPQPPTCLCGEVMYRDGDLWQCGAEHCRNYMPIHE